MTITPATPIDPVWGRDSLRTIAVDRSEFTHRSPRSESYCQTRKRAYIESLFRGALIRLRLEAAVRLASTYRHGLDLLHDLIGAWTTSPGAASVEPQAPAPVADLAHILELSQTLESRRSQIRALLARYAGLHQDTRTALRVMFLAQEISRMQAERNEVVKDLDGELHYSLRTLRSEREILSAAESRTQSPQRWKLFRKKSLAEAASSAGRQDERLHAVEARQQRLLERRDSLNRDLSRMRKTLEDLGIDPDEAGTQAKVRQSAVEVEEAEVRGALGEAFAAEREIESQLRDFSAPLAEYVSALASGREQPMLEDLMEGLSYFVTLPEPAPGLQDLLELTQRIAGTLVRASSLFSETRPSPATAAPPTTALDTDLSLDPEALLRAHAAQQTQAEMIPDQAAVHQAIKGWFVTVKERVQELPEEPMLAFEDSLVSAAPPFLHTVLSEEIRQFHEFHGSFERGC